MGKTPSVIYNKLIEMVKLRLEEEDNRKNLEQHVSRGFRITRAEAHIILKEMGRKGLIRFKGRKIKL